MEAYLNVLKTLAIVTLCFTYDCMGRVAVLSAVAALHRMGTSHFGRESIFCFE